MDAEGFATLLRSFSATPSRRGALRLVASSALGLLGWSTAPEATAHDLVKKCKKFDNKTKRKKCLKKAKQHNATHTTPAPSSPPGPDLCAGVVCGPVRNGTSACRNGVCVITSCDPGFRDCNGLVLDGCEAEIDSDLNHCGGCGVVCPGQGTDATVRCVARRCELVHIFAVEGTQSFTVPAQGTVTVEALGAQGGRGGNGSGSFTFLGRGGAGGRGGKVTASFAVTAGENLQITVGGVGGDGGNGSRPDAGLGGPGGFNGGGTGENGDPGSSSTSGGAGGGGGGGGASDVRRGGTTPSDRVVIAGGGGGGGGGGGPSFSQTNGGQGGAGGGGRGTVNGDSGAYGNRGDGSFSGQGGAGGAGGAGVGPAGAVFVAGGGGGSGQVTVSFIAD
jgi:hypothetical protein